jgi:hypothetical protein
MAFNGQTLGWVGRLPIENDPDRDQYLEYFKRNKSHYMDTETVARVAILRSYPSMSYNSFKTHFSTLLFEQTLIQSHIPFDIIFDDNLTDLSKYRVLVLAEQESLSEEQLELIRRFVVSGGGLVATGKSSYYDQWRRYRPTFGLKDLFGVDYDRQAGSAVMSGDEIRREVGKGRVVYVRDVEPWDSPTPRAGVRIAGRYWRLPKNFMQFAAAVRWASRENLGFKARLPVQAAAELLKYKDGSGLALHFVNYSLEMKPQYRLPVEMVVPASYRIDRVTIFSPDLVAESREIRFHREGDRLSFLVPELQVYDMVIVKFEEP